MDDTMLMMVITLSKNKSRRSIKASLGTIDKWTEPGEGLWEGAMRFAHANYPSWTMTGLKKSDD